jgi:hypothetical protein
MTACLSECLSIADTLTGALNAHKIKDDAQEIRQTIRVALDQILPGREWGLYLSRGWGNEGDESTWVLSIQDEDNGAESDDEDWEDEFDEIHFWINDDGQWIGYEP